MTSDWAMTSLWLQQYIFSSKMPDCLHYMLSRPILLSCLMYLVGYVSHPRYVQSDDTNALQGSKAVLHLRWQASSAQGRRGMTHLCIYKCGCASTGCQNPSRPPPGFHETRKQPACAIRLLATRSMKRPEHTCSGDLRAGTLRYSAGAKCVGGPNYDSDSPEGVRISTRNQLLVSSIAALC